MVGIDVSANFRCKFPKFLAGVQLMNDNIKLPTVNFKLNNLHDGFEIEDEVADQNGVTVGKINTWGEVSSKPWSWWHQSIWWVVVNLHHQAQSTLGMTRDGDVDVLGPKNALLRAFPINDLGAQSLSSFQRSVGPVKPGGPFSTILRLPFVGAAKNHQWGPVSGCYDSFWPRILSVKRWIWTVNENCHNDSAPQQWPKLPMDSWGGCWPLSWRHKWWYFPDV